MSIRCSVYPIYQKNHKQLFLLVLMEDKMLNARWIQGNIKSWFKGAVHPKIGKDIFKWGFSAVYPSRCFCSELTSFRDFGHRDVRLLSNIMGMNVILSVVIKAAEKYIWEIQQLWLLPEIITCLLKITHRVCSEQFNVQTIVFYWNQGAHTCVFGAMIRERSSTFLWMISTKLGNSQMNHLDV